MSKEGGGKRQSDRDEGLRRRNRSSPPSKKLRRPDEEGPM